MFKFDELIIEEIMDAEILPLDTLKSVRKSMHEKQISFYDAVMELDPSVYTEVIKFLGNKFGIPYIGLLTMDNVDTSLKLDQLITFIAENRCIPYKKDDNYVYVVIDNPLLYVNASILESTFELPVKLECITPSNMDDLLSQITNKDRRDRAIQEMDEENKKDAASHLKSNSLDDYLSAPAIALANTLIEEAINMGASDIHIEPMEKVVRVRFRLDGVLQNHLEIQHSMFNALLARFKIMADLDIAERRIPQDGKITYEFADKAYDIRVSTMPLIYGEKLVLRLYSSTGQTLKMDDLSDNPIDNKKLKNLISTPNGIILLTGPTGSGKTTTLYTFLRELNKTGVNIQTVEDPVENVVEGINQLQTNNKTGLTFASALRAILRQDPNIIMVGEIRDEETAHIAVQAAITGHLVLSTIHTNDAATTVSRLIDMGVEPYLVSDSLNGAISQRLVRKLCPYCKQEHIVTEHEGKELGIKPGTIVYEPKGCNHCKGTGYKGRQGVFEIMVMGKNLRESIDQKKFGLEELEEAALKDGLVTLRERAAELIKKGITSIEEYNTLISHIEEDE